MADSSSDKKRNKSAEEAAQTDEVIETDNDTQKDAALNLSDEEPKPERFVRLKRLARAYWQRKKWTLPLTIVLLIVLILAVPLSRYKVLGLFIKQPFTIAVVDSTNGKPVSAAAVTIADKVISTNGEGRASVKVAVGPQTVSISKKYYKPLTRAVTVPISGANAPLQLQLEATGRQVPVTIINKITGKGLAGVTITVLGTNSKTDRNGKAIIVLPTTAKTQKAVLHLDGYNTVTSTIEVTDQMVAANNFALAPSGKVYFLSNQSGKIDVVKTNLDGTDRQVVLAGTGAEDEYTTSLLASRDWNYLALLAKRDGGKQGIYLINNATGKTTNIDGGNEKASFTLVGWSDATFIYQISHSDVSNWQSGAQILKSYDAASDKLYSIDQTQGEGTGQYDYGFTSFSPVYIIDSQLLYAKNWYSSSSPNHLDGKSASLVSAKTDGSGKKTVQDFPIPTGNLYYYLGLAPYEPAGVYVSAPGTNASSATTYYEYEGGKFGQQSSVTSEQFNKTYPTFLQSPSGKSTFWSEIRDNKNTLFVGDASAKNSQQIATLSDYSPYGWYSDKYLLLSKNGSELYIEPVGGSKTPFKITNYYKPQLTYRGYGGGYGGL